MSERIEQLFLRYLDNRCTPEEIRQVWAFLEGNQDHPLKEAMLRRYLEHIPGDVELSGSMDPLLEERLKKQFALIRATILQEEVVSVGKVHELKTGKWRRQAWLVAASLLVFVASGMYLLFFYHPRRSTIQPYISQHSPVKDIPPGSSKALLTLSNGSVINLDDAQNGTLTQQGNTRIRKLNDGQLIYDQLRTEPATTGYNTLSTPRGGQYRLILPDGSQVWLNAASAIRYPTAFTGNERLVEISGEAYFEIEKNPSVPFRVRVVSSLASTLPERDSVASPLSVQVLGTHFNINAYTDETSVKTTLLEGAVNIIRRQTVIPLRPGEQAQSNKEGKTIVVSDINTDETIAWKNGHFLFSHVSLQVLMRQLARWYDVEIVYGISPPVLEFEGEIQMDLSLQQVMKILEKYRVHCLLDHKKLIVMPPGQK
ncbi:FecR family protein [Flavitalea flava]